MLILHYDPTTTELSFIERDLPPVTANFSELELTTNLALNQGTVTVNNIVNLTETGTMTIASGSIVEVI